ncbi:hypothetical protein THAOC_25406, partial [Thalassiosira oceanica]
MAYALAVERVDRAVREGTAAAEGGGDYEEDEGGYETMSDEDMMRLMEEEMRREIEAEEEAERARAGRGEAAYHTGKAGEDGPGPFQPPAAFAAVRDDPNPFQKKKARRPPGDGPNPFQKKAKGPAPYRSRPLADMVKHDGRARSGSTSSPEERIP